MLDFAPESKGIERRLKCFELGLLVVGDAIGSKDALVRRHRRVVFSDVPCTFPHFLFELHGGQKEVLQLARGPCVDFIHDGDDGLLSVSVVAKELSDVAPVFLLYVGVVVLLVGP